MNSIAQEITPKRSRFLRWKKTYEDNESHFAIAFFVGGFIFDLVTLDRIDSWLTIGQQIFYLVFIQAALMQMFFEEARTPRDYSQDWFIKRWYFDYRTAIIHFFFGNLLNLYTIFFFKSSSLLVSFFFMLVLVALLLANESLRFKSLGLSFKFGLLSLCYLAFFSYVLPIFIGSIGLLVFLLSMAVGTLPIVAMGWWIQNFRQPMFENAKSKILAPMGITLLSFLLLYFLKLIPPVPLSIPFIGVYHSVEKSENLYRMGHQRPWWRIWHNGDQHFLAQRTDKIYVAFRIFSPARFSDQVMMRWYWHDNQLGWILQDTIPIRISGGRDEGFRGYGVKSNYQPGQWRVQVETGDGREIGRVYFDLAIGPEIPRSFEYDTM